MTPVNPSGGPPDSRFNLSEWSLRHRSLVLYLIVAFALIGFMSYEKLGQSEDPPFTFKVMVVKTNWPGAAAHEVEDQVTDHIERKLQEVPNVDWVRSYSKPGESLVFFAIKDSAPASVVPETWYQVRKKIGDIRNTLPAGIQGPFFNDEFGDVYTNIYALTGDGFGYRELKDFGDRVRTELLRVPGVAKVDFIGEQDEKIFIEMSNAKLATLGVDPTQIIQTLAAQNVVAAAGPRCHREDDDDQGATDHNFLPGRVQRPGQGPSREFRQRTYDSLRTEGGGRPRFSRGCLTMPRVSHGEPKGGSAGAGQASRRGAGPAALGEAERPGFRAVASVSCGRRSPAAARSTRTFPADSATSQQLPQSPSTLKSMWWNWVARQRVDPHLPIHSDPALTLRYHVRLTTAVRAKAVSGLDDVTRATLERAEEKILDDAQPRRDNVVALASRRR